MTYLYGQDHHTEEEHKDEGISPIRHLWIVLHQLCVDIVLLHLDPQPIKHSPSVVQYHVHDDASGERKHEQVRDCVRRRHVERRILVVRCQVEGVILHEDMGDVVHITILVVGLVVKDGEVGELPSLLRWAFSTIQ